MVSAKSQICDLTEWVEGEKCQWHFARKSSDAIYNRNREVSGSRNVTETFQKNIYPKPKMPCNIISMSISVVSSAIIKKGDAFLFVKETKPAAAGKWNLPGGKLEAGESVIDCLHREVREETGYVVTSEDLLCIINKPVSREGNTTIRFIFKCEVGDKPYETAEHEYEFLQLSEVEKLTKQDLIRSNETYSLLLHTTQTSANINPLIKIL